MTICLMCSATGFTVSHSTGTVQKNFTPALQLTNFGVRSSLVFQMLPFVFWLFVMFLPCLFMLSRLGLGPSPSP